MARRMLIDATHPDEARVVVISGNKVDEFDYETANKTQLKGNIYLAKITRVEPSLQAAFVDYGGNRHGFLPFSEIHPDYYRIPIADREALVAEEENLRAELARVEEAEAAPSGGAESEGREAQASESEEDAGEADDEAGGEAAESAPRRRGRGGRGAKAARVTKDSLEADVEATGEVVQIEAEASVDTVGGDDVEDAARRRAKLMRHYKIQEVIKRRQVILVQVAKEERGTKGAALTTYLSLAGRYCVLMPNTGKGGGISRKISNATDRRRLKSVVSELDIPEGMAVIVRTAGSQRTKAEIRRDYEYLLRLWDEIRTKTLQSNAPQLIHEEANLIKRCMRDLYSREMDEVLVEGEEGYKAARAFMKMLMPSHVKNIQFYNDPDVPLYHRYQVETQLDAMYSPSVQLKSGGSIVLNSTEALVAIDVNSGRATKERHIEETALKTNLEAADEVARQLRLRDLAGLIVIDFIDMEDPRHNREVERRLKEAMRGDRARIQLGRISPFGLLELSRQRLRPSLFETEMVQCQHCHGTGFLRSPNSSSLHALRALTEEAIKNGSGTLEIAMATPVALYLLNEKRSHLRDMEVRYGVTVLVRANDSLTPPKFELTRLTSEGAVERIVSGVEEEGEAPELEARGGSEEERRERRSRGRRGGRRRRGEGEDGAVESRTAAEDNRGRADRVSAAPLAAEPDSADMQDRSGRDLDDEEIEIGEEGERRSGEQAAEGSEEGRAKRRRRGKRGGRRRSRRSREEGGEPSDSAMTEEAEAGQAAASEQISEDGEATEVEDGARPDARENLPAAASASAEVATASAETDEKPAETKPKRARRVRKKAPGSVAKAEREEAPAVTEASEAAESSVAEEVALEQKPKRARRAPKAAAPKAAAQPTAQPEAEAASAETAPSPQEAPSAEPLRSREPAVADAPAAPKAEPAMAEEETGASQPRRRGWWNRLLE